MLLIIQFSLNYVRGEPKVVLPDLAVSAHSEQDETSPYPRILFLLG